MSIQNFDQALNLKIKVTTLLDQEISGIIYTFSSSNEILVLKTTNIRQTKDKERDSTAASTSTYRVINTSFIKSIQVLSPHPQKKNKLKPYKSDDVSIKPISVADLKRFVDEEVLKYQNEPSEKKSAKTAEDSKQQQQQSQALSKQAHAAAPVEKPAPAAPAGSTGSTAPSSNRQSQSQAQAQPPASSTASLLLEKLQKLYGDSNVRYGHTNQKQTEIIIYDEIKITKPFTNTAKNVSFINPKQQQSKHSASLNRALKHFWLDIDNEKKGG
ncbi:uncharacterized protein LODBEIA_P60280 [Lodderomyces beijingensis]|uniref:LSM12 anticodon-binding domain-containing protein n=1 Tax=Lodderomyces beijingensis TaxID=1775926 RepID=A0ABP0ZUI5_9ASCO